MHELSIALGLVEAACEEAERLGNVRVETLHVRVGALSGVVKEALLFAFDQAAAGTAIEGARLQVDPVLVVVWCETCGAERTLEHAFVLACPICSAPAAGILRGRELQLVALEVLEVGDAAENR